MKRTSNSPRDKVLKLNFCSLKLNSHLQSFHEQKLCKYYKQTIPSSITLSTYIIINLNVNIQIVADEIFKISNTYTKYGIHNVLFYHR